MYFKKFPNAANFDFINRIHWDGDQGMIHANAFADGQITASKKIQVKQYRYAEDIYRVTFESSDWPKNYAQSELNFPALAGDSSATDWAIDESMQFTLTDGNGQILLRSLPAAGFGICGTRSLFQFERTAEDRFYGMGEKMLGLELSGKSTKFWNTDVLADFEWSFAVEGRPDPSYVSIPYVIIKRGSTYIGLLLDNPCATFISTSSSVSIAGLMDADEHPAPVLTLGAENGQPNLIVMVGPSLPELTRKMQRLVGCTPLPPAWALGYHQCRWGYKSVDCLKYLDAAMNRYEIPCDGLWLDIDYMRGYRVFTFDKNHFPDPENNLKEIQQSGRRIVPIIDPGVKAEDGYNVYDDGKENDIFCKNPQGRDFVGQVWPGRTVFPDFSMEQAKKWWTEQVKSFAEKGITAAWVDMNDPSTGSVLNTDMLFNEGRESHDLYHNQYASGMAEATVEGFRQARPEDRPFLLSRSGFTGCGNYTAIWTGDNISNYHYLRSSIACSLNLALSGIPFNGPDIGGFMGDTTPELMRDWMKAGFLFPFCRNHSVLGSREQEPWMFDAFTLAILREYIQLRYRLRPYLYNLFVAQAECGEAVLRPMFYDFEETSDHPLAYIDDQFMVGPFIMQAPFVDEKLERRDVVLPTARWYAVDCAKWMDGNQKISVEQDDRRTPMYIREGAVLPIALNEGRDFSFSAADVEIHIFLSTKSTMAAETTYVFDDGQTLAYHRGVQSELKIHAQVDGNEILVLDTQLIRSGFGSCYIARFVVYDAFNHVTINGRTVETNSETIRFAGQDQTCTSVTIPAN
ncbi:MAG: hypothetical protein EOL87_18220 [Spartobacteria bacterium]|nr:hypothetical protein [Spartobacteria bacterium]